MLKDTIIKLLTTPDELREIANKMEKTWPKLSPADSVMVTNNLVKSSHGEMFWISFGIDQTKMKK